jgi:tRNA(fMet)-specific endonuclease VapC
MDGSYLLDTNIIIGLFANELQAIQLIEKADEVSIPIISVGELYYGANKSYRKKNNLERIEEFISSVRVIECGLSTAHWYGLIKGDLKSKGRPIPENDIWIAAIAREHELILVSRGAHFQAVPGLKLTFW